MTTLDEYLTGEKANPADQVDRSVMDVPNRAQSGPGVPAAPATFTLWTVSAAADGFSPWGTNPKVRDQQLREFIPTETFFASALGTVCARNAALSWDVTGAPRSAKAAVAMLNDAEFGGGWEEFAVRVSTDLYTQDCGAFVEFIREGDSETSPVVGIKHLDAARCFPTGDPEWPILYQDIRGRYHWMKWHQVRQLLEMPAPVVSNSAGFFYKLQYSALTRLLRAAQILKSAQLYKYEKLTGRHDRQVVLVQGVDTNVIRDNLERHQIGADAKGMQRFITPAIVGSANPLASVDAKVVDLIGLPDGFNEKETIELYILAMSMAFLTDYQEFAPLPGGGLGTSSQSEILDRKSHGKGPALWQKLILRLMNHAGALPANVEFQFDEPDPAAEREEAEIRKIRAEERSIRIASGEIDAEVAAQLALDSGDLSEEVYEAFFPLEQPEPAPVQVQFDEQGQPIPQSPGSQPGGSQPRKRGDVTPELSVEGESQTGAKGRGLHVVDPVMDTVTHVKRAAKARGEYVTLGELINGRLHRAYATTADDLGSLGYFDTIEERRRVASAIGPALEVFEAELRSAGLWDVQVRAEDADDIVERALKAVAGDTAEYVTGRKVDGEFIAPDEVPVDEDVRPGKAEIEERAGPDASRLVVEADNADLIEGGLLDIRRRVRARLAAED